MKTDTEVLFPDRFHLWSLCFFMVIKLYIFVLLISIYNIKFLLSLISVW